MNFEVIQKEEKIEVCIRCGGVPVVTDRLCRFCFEEDHPEFYREEQNGTEKHSSAGNDGGKSGDAESYDAGRRKVQKIFSKKKKRKGGNEFSST